ncbi:hypothetical protein ACISK3_00665 [Morganella morganii]
MSMTVPEPKTPQSMQAVHNGCVPGLLKTLWHTAGSSLFVMNTSLAAGLAE